MIQEGKPLCIYTAVKEMTDYENLHVIKEAQDVYQKEIQDLIGASLGNNETMSKFHLKSLDKAIGYLRKEFIYNDVELLMDTAMV